MIVDENNYIRGFQALHTCFPCNYFFKSQKSIFQQFGRFVCTVSSRISDSRYLEPIFDRSWLLPIPITDISKSATDISVNRYAIPGKRQKILRCTRTNHPDKLGSCLFVGFFHFRERSKFTGGGRGQGGWLVSENHVHQNFTAPLEACALKFCPPPPRSPCTNVLPHPRQTWYSCVHQYTFGEARGGGQNFSARASRKGAKF